MKRLLLAIAVLISTQSFGQDSPYKYFRKDGNTVYFEAIYEMPNVSKDSLLKILPAWLKGKGASIMYKATVTI